MCKHQVVYATQPLGELLHYHVPQTLLDVVDCMRRLTVEIPRLQSQADALQRTWTPEAAALLKQVEWVGNSLTPA